MYIIILLTVPLIAWYLVTINPFYRKIGRWWAKNIGFKGKPFFCEFCTGFWLSLATYWTYSINYLDLALISLANGVLTFLVYLSKNGK